MNCSWLICLFLEVMLNRLKQLHRIYFIFIIFLFFVLFFPPYYLLSRHPGGYLWLNRFRKLHSLLCGWCTGIFFRFTAEVPLLPGQTYIYCSNHTSNIDIMILCVLASGRFHFMGKEELLKAPILGLFFKTIDIPVNRDSKMSAFRAFKRAGENLEKGMSLVIFPEGKIDDVHYPPVLQEFKNGPFRLAIEKNIPIVAISITDAWKKMWDDGAKYGSRPGICDIYIHKPISTKDLASEDADELKDKVFDLIKSKLVTHEDR